MILEKEFKEFLSRMSDFPDNSYDKETIFSLRNLLSAVYGKEFLSFFNDCLDTDGDWYFFNNDAGEALNLYLARLENDGHSKINGFPRG